MYRKNIPARNISRGPRRDYIPAIPWGKTPGIPNVKHNHIEKTEHPCQFPVELIERLVLALTNEGDLVIDPYAGVASALCAAVKCGRRAAEAETSKRYIDIGLDRIVRMAAGDLQTRPMDRPVYKPNPRTSVAQNPWDAGASKDGSPGLPELRLL